MSKGLFAKLNDLKNKGVKEVKSATKAVAKEGKKPKG
tara:strand:+ start:1070 stop:1180 length:111 start_codon:yes stop_codon:yes gene_type:complete